MHTCRNLWLLLWLCVQQTYPAVSMRHIPRYRPSILKIATANSWARSLTSPSAVKHAGESDVLPPEGSSSDVNLTALLYHWTQQVAARYSTVPTGRDEAPGVHSGWLTLLGVETVAQVVLRHLLRPPGSRSDTGGWQQKEDILRVAAVAEDVGQALAAASRAEAKEHATGSAPHNYDLGSCREREVSREGGTVLVHEALPVLRMLLPLSEKSSSGATRLVPAFPLFTQARHLVLRRDLTLLRRLHSCDRNAFPWLQASFSLPPRRPPPPWTALRRGGLSDLAAQERQRPCVKVCEESCQLQALLKDERRGRLRGLFAGLNTLGSTAWTVNRRVLEVARQLAQRGDINSAATDGSRPADNALSTCFLAPLPVLLPALPATSFSSQRHYASYRQTRAIMRVERDKAASRLMEARLALQMAEDLAASSQESAAFYLPYAADFRGRVYSLVPHLCPTGGSFARSLLQFHRGRVLGPDGLFWLKVQLANSFGWGKLSLQERVQRVDHNLASIRASATDPMGVSGAGPKTASSWWRSADSPWLCLAACFEVHSALQHAESRGCEGDGCEDFVSHLPVMLDGSCNGLQHYAALARDPAGGDVVNLMPSSQPMDAYAAVAAAINAQVLADSLNCSERSTEGVRTGRLTRRQLAQRLAGRVSDRRIFKKAVMTSVYGATLYRIRQNLMVDLLKLRLIETPLVPQAASYLAEVFQDCFQKKIFRKTRAVQQWLMAVAREVGHSVRPDRARRLVYSPPRGPEAGLSAAYPHTRLSWTAPVTGFRVHLPYDHKASEGLPPHLRAVNARRQASSFPANYIHSLDASHMFATAKRCSEACVEFASVHDCFWTHAGSAPCMNRILREEFVKLYANSSRSRGSGVLPILSSLRLEMVERYGRNLVPTRGLVRHTQRQKALKRPAFRAQDWRPIRIPELPPQLLEESEELLNISHVLRSDYFFH